MEADRTPIFLVLYLQSKKGGKPKNEGETPRFVMETVNTRILGCLADSLCNVGVQDR
jgi:hypothetical protein